LRTSLFMVSSDASLFTRAKAAWSGVAATAACQTNGHSDWRAPALSCSGQSARAVATHLVRWRAVAVHHGASDLCGRSGTRGDGGIKLCASNPAQARAQHTRGPRVSHATPPLSLHHTAAATDAEGAQRSAARRRRRTPERGRPPPTPTRALSLQQARRRQARAPRTTFPSHPPAVRTGCCWHQACKSNEMRTTNTLNFEHGPAGRRLCRVTAPSVDCAVRDVDARRAGPRLRGRRVVAR